MNRNSMAQLVGLANNTKWTELQSHMADVGARAPYWRTQATNGFIYPEAGGWDADWTYHFRLGEYKHIEWCEVTPREVAGALSMEEVIHVCKTIGFKYEVAPNAKVIRIIGYQRL